MTMLKCECPNKHITENYDCNNNISCINCKNNKSLRAATGKGYLDIKELQLEGKKRMDVASFLNGYQIDAVKFGE